jgi:hypothetical protein
MSVQSLNPATMAVIKRDNMATNNVTNIMELSDRTGVSTYSEFILGLPLETLESWKQGLSKIVEMGQHNSIDIWFGQMLANTELNNPESIKKYGIKTIIAKDLYPQYSKDDWREPPEEIEIINETNTMSREQMIEAYMYAWMYIHFHTTGYTQILSRYCNDIKSITYHDFYETLWKIMPQQEWLYTHFIKIKSIVDHYLKYGNISDEDSDKNNGLGSGMHRISFAFFYHNREKIYNLGKQIVGNLTGKCPEDLVKLQRHFIFDPAHQYPLKIDVSFDPIQWKGNPVTVFIDSRFDKEQIMNTQTGKIAHGATITTEIKNKEGEIGTFDMYILRRKGLLKNFVLSKI